jgi:DNA-binding transcriptional ArsR family regulator
MDMPNPHDVLFRTLADPTRRALFERLCREGEQTVGALTARAKISQPAVSKHLALLRKPGWCALPRTAARPITARAPARSHL